MKLLQTISLMTIALLWGALANAQDAPAPEEAPDADSDETAAEGDEEASEAPDAEEQPEPEPEPEPTPPPETVTKPASEGPSAPVVETAEADEEAEEVVPLEEPKEKVGWSRGDFLDTRISFVFTDSNLLAGPEDRSKQAGFTPVDDEEFYENLQSEKRGWETETHLVVYGRTPSYFKYIDAEAALVFELENWVDSETNEVSSQFGDDGSYLKLNFYTEAYKYDGDNVSLTLFPFDSQRFLLGYTYDITWGGEKIFPNKEGQVPGAKLQYNFNVGEEHQGYVFAGVKTASLLNSSISEFQTYYGLLAGGGLDFTRWLRWDLNGGYFQRGSFPQLGCTDATEEGESEDCETSEVSGETMDAFGGSTRLVLHDGIPVQNSVDFRLYSVTPDWDRVITEPQRYDDGLSWSLGGEFTYVMQSLISVEDTDSTELMPSKAAAANGKLMFHNARLHADFIYRDLSYVVFDIPGVWPYHGYPETADISPEWFIAAGIDYYFETPRLTPGLIFAYKRPAVYTSTNSETGEETSLVYRSDEDVEILPAGQDPFDIMAFKASLKWDLAPGFIILGELKYTLDKNQSRIGDDGVREWESDNVTNRLGFSILAQAKF